MCLNAHFVIITISLNSPSSLSRLALANSTALLTAQPNDSMENLLHVQRLTNDKNEHDTKTKTVAVMWIKKSLSSMYGFV